MSLGERVLALFVLWQLAEGMLETQIKKDALLATAGANADWYADTRHNLQSIFKVVCPPNSRAEKERS